MTKRPIISLCTISSRKSSVAETIRSILDQSIDDFEVRLHISTDPFLLDEGISGEELELPADPRLSVFSVPNHGPYRKLLFSLKHADYGQPIITIDDDTIYPPNFIEEMINLWKEHRCVIAKRGLQLRAIDGKIAPYKFCQNLERDHATKLANLPTGKDGILYFKEYFHPIVYQRGSQVLTRSDLSHRCICLKSFVRCLCLLLLLNI